MATSPGDSDDAPADSPAPFTWPPRPITPSDAPPRWRRAGAESDERDADLLRAGEQPASALEAFERYWLGRTSRRFIDRARLRGWAPDLPGAYCPRCGSRVGLYELGPEGGDVGLGGCAGCEQRRLPWARAVRLGDYTGLLRRAVHELKFHRWRPVGRELGTLLGVAIRAAVDQAGARPEDCRLTPVPTPWWRRLARGVDHTAVLARAAAASAGIALAPGLTRRWRPSQLAVTPSSRTANVRGSFRVRGSAPPRVRLTILIDDVRTTGATMMEACRTLRRGWGDSFVLWTATVAVAGTRRRPLAWNEERGPGGAGNDAPGPSAVRV